VKETEQGKDARYLSVYAPLVFSLIFCTPAEMMLIDNAAVGSWMVGWMETGRKKRLDYGAEMKRN
jgi:hypothetical protein